MALVFPGSTQNQKDLPRGWTINISTSILMDDKISLLQGISRSGNIIVQIGAGFRVEGEPSVLSQTDVTQSTPLQQFLKCRNLQEAGQDTTTMPPTSTSP